MESALPRVSERSLRLFGENRILAVVFPAHTTNIFQALDLGFFADGRSSDHCVNDQMTQLIQAYQ
jgi:hypothetical protein